MISNFKSNKLNVPEWLRLFVSAGVGEALHAEGELLEARHERGDAEGEARLLQRLDVLLRRQANLPRVEELGVDSTETILSR